MYIDVKIEELPQEVYEIELEQTIPGSGAVSAVSGSVLRPGLVIDDPFLIQSIVNSEAAAPDLGEAANTVEEEVEEGTVFKENIFVESQNIVAETQDIFVNPSEEQFAAFSGSVEEVPILEYSDYYTVGGGYDYNENGFEDYSDNNNEVEEVVEQEVEKEPSLHCDLSILLSGISCSFNLLDEDTAPALAPAPLPDLTPPPLRTPAPTPPPAVVAPWSTVQQSLTVTGEQVKEVEEESEVPFLGLDIEADEDEDDGQEDVTEVADVTKERLSLITNTTAAEATAAGEEDKELRHVVNHLEELHQD